MRESEIISRFFNFAADDSVEVSVGDDAAVLVPPPGSRLAFSADTLIEGAHFFSDVDARLLARKSAAVSLSDMAAMGARPLWMTIALSANKDNEWFGKFAEGLKSSAKEFHYAIVGGDLCRAGQVTVTSSVVGEMPDKPLLRSGASVGDEVWLSGATGEAAFAARLRAARHNGESANANQEAGEQAEILNFAPSAEHRKLLDQKLDDPSPRVALGQTLTKIASAAIDISDGLIAAASSLSANSKVQIVLQMNSIPVSPALADLPRQLQHQLICGGGDEYELLFCAPAAAHAAARDTGSICIGKVTAGEGAYIQDADGGTIQVCGYEHHFGE